MYELKIPSPKFVQAALRAGEEAGFEGATLLLSRGLTSSHQKELLDSWSEIDDLTHNDILVLTLGVTRPHSGISACNIERNIIADEVSVAYPFSDPFSKSFSKLSDVANHIPDLPIYSEPSTPMINSHGVTDIRRALRIAEHQLPALLIVSYRQKISYLVELGSSKAEQLSPVEFLFALTRNLSDIPYLYNRFMDKVNELPKQRMDLRHNIGGLEHQIVSKRKELGKFASVGQLESVIYHIFKTLVDAPIDIKNTGTKLINYLSGKDEDLEIINKCEASVIEYALSVKASVSAGRLPKKLRKAGCVNKNETDFAFC